ncbi:(2Fe-2S)-binding protein [Pseudogracilibacillus auburnensis]|uniref:2Fe-2S iron-sulfur cluster protein n=1 Tax=Pseudogracilibacillus auburnensis TaxID=1494959 RepID=A0A2V3W496_9BACI|nr:(2Fe-2S)-binding protein [Pseudogracilibacillus auburnensis]PXW87891.1 2Fe-2S iron-sulfur cluster protein [Pseudogracilibacillus auburnensis]
MRIQKHPVMKIIEKEDVEFIFNDTKIIGKKGDSLASALWANGMKTLRQTEKENNSRGIYCGIGNCYDCRVYLQGSGMVRACITPIKSGMEFYSEDRGDMSS